MELKNLIADSEKVRVYESDGKCIKVFKDPNEPKSVVLYEALTHTRVEETGCRRIPSFEGIAKVNGNWAIIFDFIEGKTLEQIMRENPSKSDVYLEQMIDLQIEINSLRSAKVSRLTDYLKRSIESLDIIDDVKKYELLTKLSAFPKHSKLCHGDFSPDNIIVTPKKELFVIDWLKAKQGNASADVAKTYLNFCLKHHTEWAEKYVKIYCSKSGTDPHYVKEWLPIVAAAQLKFKRPEEHELLLAWLDVTE